MVCPRGILGMFCTVLDAGKRREDTAKTRFRRKNWAKIEKEPLKNIKMPKNHQGLAVGEQFWNFSRSAFASRRHARALAACLPRQDHVYITPDGSLCFHNNIFDKMPCKLDSTENLRSFDKYPTQLSHLTYSTCALCTCRPAFFLSSAALLWWSH